MQTKMRFKFVQNYLSPIMEKSSEGFDLRNHDKDSEMKFVFSEKNWILNVSL